MGWEAGVPAGFDERTTGSPKDIEIDLALLCTRQVGEVQCRPRPPPSASEAVMIGVVRPKERCSSRNLWDRPRPRGLRALSVSRAPHRRRGGKRAAAAPRE
jgi:hypothetical protein